MRTTSQTQHYPIGPKPCRIWRDGVEVDIEMQELRVRHGCFCDGITTDENGKITRYDMCPSTDKVVSKLQCEIFQDQVKLKLPISQLACCGGLNPADDEEYENLARCANDPDFEFLDSDDLSMPTEAYVETLTNEVGYDVIDSGCDD